MSFIQNTILVFLVLYALLGLFFTHRAYTHIPWDDLREKYEMNKNQEFVSKFLICAAAFFKWPKYVLSNNPPNKEN